LDEQHASDENWVLLTWGLMAAWFVFGITPLVGVVIAYIKRADTRDEFVWSHMTYVIRTFWGWLGMIVLSTALILSGAFGMFFDGVSEPMAGFWAMFGGSMFSVAAGVILSVALVVWFVVRIVRGLMAGFDHRPVRDPNRFW